MERNLSTVAKLFVSSARRWNEMVIYHSSLLYINGEGVKQNNRKAVGLLKLVVELGEPEAISLLETIE